MLTIKNVKEQTKQEQFAEYFGDLYFNEEKHQYTVGYGGNTLTSVTTYIKTLQEPFKTNQIASVVAKSKRKKGINVDSDYIKRYWKTKGALSREVGNLAHLYASAMPNLDVPQTGYEESIKAFYEEVIEPNFEILATELPMYSGGMAGTGDLITITDDGTVQIWDYKTSADLNKSYNKFKAPLENYKDSQRNQYTIQLWLYKKLVEDMTPYKVSSVHIVKITDTGYTVVDINQELFDYLTELNALKQA